MEFMVYLAGMMEFAPKSDDGTAWRDEVQPKLEALKMQVFNPCKLEASPVKKAGFDSYKDWKASKKTDLDRYLDGMREIILYDLDALDKCAMVLVYIEPGMTGGTIGEVTHAYRNLGIPVLAVLAPGLERKDVGGWILGCVTEFADDLDDAVDKIWQFKEVSEFIKANPDEWMGWLNNEVKGKE